MKRLLASTFFLIAAELFAADGGFLLTDNNQPGWGSNYFREDPKIPTGVELFFVTDGDFACDEYMVETGSRPDGKKRVLLDGRLGPEGDCQAYGKWGKSAYGTFTLDFKQPYLIERVLLWAQAKDNIGTGEFEVLLSNDNEKFVSVGSCKIDPAVRTAADNLGVKNEFKLEKPAAARYVQLRPKKREGAWQQILSEVAVYGRKVNREKLLELSPENQRPQIDFKITGIEESAVKLDWSEFASRVSGIKGWHFYEADGPAARVTDPGVRLLAELPANVTEKLIYPLEPESDYYYGVSVVYNDGEDPNFRVKKHTTPKPLAYDVFGDMLAINHYWGGQSEGTRPDRKQHHAWNDVAVQMLATTPVKSVRWWRNYPQIVEKYYDLGINIFTFPGEQQANFGKTLGSHAYTAGNEPHLWGKPAQVYLDGLKKNHALIKAACPRNIITAPTTGLDDNALKFLEELYQLGAKDYFDVLDLHTYVGAIENDPRLPGYPKGAPEALIERMEKVRALMAKYGDENKPVISTEYGYTDGQIANPIGFPISREQIAEFLIRGLILHNVLGYERVYIYSFWDSGTNPNDTEQHFGMLDYYMQKKPSYYAFCTLGRVLGNSRLKGPVKGCDNKLLFGYEYQDRDTNAFNSVIWDGRGRFSGTFKTEPGKVIVTALKGEQSEIYTRPDGTFRLIYGTAPVYITSDAPVELLNSTAIEGEEKAAERIEFAPANRIVVLPAGATEGTAEFTLNNPTRETFEVTAVLETSDGRKLAEKHVSCAPNSVEKLSFPVKPAENLILDKFKLTIGYEGKYASFSDECEFYVRKLQPSDGKIHVTTARMFSYNQDVYVLSDDFLEVTVDPKRGGRILEMYDKVRRANQVNISYDQLAGIEQVNFYYCIYDMVRAPAPCGISKSEPYQLEVIPNGVRMWAGGDGRMMLEKILTIDGAGSMDLHLTMTNKTDKALECSYYMHPEYTVGGTGDHETDVFKLPIADRVLTMPFWTGLGDKPTGDYTENWWVVEDTVNNVQLRQEFQLDKFRTPRIWFGLGCYNLEMESVKGLKLEPGANWQGDLKWTLSELKK